MANQSNHQNHVWVEGDGHYPEIYCPVCGEKTIFTDKKCPHVLFKYDDSNLDGFRFEYVHPKLQVAVKDLTEKYVGYAAEAQLEDVDPKVWDAFEKDEPEPFCAFELASKLNMDPDSTIVLIITNMFSAPACSDIVDTAVGFEFPPGSTELKSYMAKLLSEAER